MYGDVQAFVRVANKATSLDTIADALVDMTERLGFRHHVLVQRTSSRNLNPLRLVNYPAQWVDLVLSRGLYDDDPVLTLCEKTCTGFTWDTVPNLIKLTERQQAYMTAARNEGLDHGYTVPLHVPGEAIGLCSFVTGEGVAVPKESLPAAQYVACFAFEAARRIGMDSARAEAIDQDIPRLTQRQLDCVILISQGKSDWVIAELLSLSTNTVHKHIEAAKKKLGVASRTELVVRALFDGQVTFSDVIH